MKRLKTAAAEAVCGQNVRFLGSMDARRDADAGRRAVCGQRVPGSAPDLHDDGAAVVFPRGAGDLDVPTQCKINHKPNKKTKINAN